MNKSLGIALLVVGGLILGALIFGAGFMVGNSNYGATNFGPFNSALAPEFRASVGRDFARQGFSMMGNGQNMMGGGYNMMWGYTNGSTASTTPLTIDQARQAVEGYLKGLNNSDLELKEIMIFNNHAYARITEKSTGIGAMELLVDPTSLSVFPEYGPNMMWNLKYGHMSGYGMMGGSSGMMGGRGMMGGYNNAPVSVSAKMTVTSEQALRAAQQYLDQEYPGYKSAEDADPFYGYYTIDILKDGQPTGMLSVNGFSGQVFVHTWHGTFIEMYE